MFVIFVVTIKLQSALNHWWHI